MATVTEVTKVTEYQLTLTQDELDRLSAILSNECNSATYEVYDAISKYETFRADIYRKGFQVITAGMGIWVPGSFQIKAE